MARLTEKRCRCGIRVKLFSAKTKLQSQERQGSTTWGCSRVSERFDVHSEAEEPETDNRKGFWGSCPLKKQETCTNRVFMSSSIYQRALWHEHRCTSWRCCTGTAWCSGDCRWLLVTQNKQQTWKTAAQQLWGSEGCHYHVHISGDSSDDTSGQRILVVVIQTTVIQRC